MFASLQAGLPPICLNVFVPNDLVFLISTKNIHYDIIMPPLCDRFVRGHSTMYSQTKSHCSQIKDRIQCMKPQRNKNS